MSDLSRRTFLRAATLTVATAAFPLAGAEQALAAPDHAGSALRALPVAPRSGAPALTRSDFTPHLRTVFRMTGPSGRPASTPDRAMSGARAVLEEVTDLRGAAPGDENRFSLVFSVPRTTGAHSGVYRFERTPFGRMDLFAVPVDRGRNARYFQVVVNRPV